MWVEADPRTFVKDQRIAMRYDAEDELMQGSFVGQEGYIVRFHRVALGHPMHGALYSANVNLNRKFYKWVEDKPEDSHNQLDVDHSKLRLRQPDPDRHPEIQVEVETAEAALLKRIARLEGQVARIVRVGTQQYVVNEGDHLRVWWEDGRLHTEYVQGENE